MEISCDIIRDLLPLYAEDLTSPDSNKLVENHISNCEVCTRQLGLMKKVQVIPVDVDVNSIKRVGDTIRRRRILAVMTALLFVATLVLGGALLLDAKIYLTAEQAIESVEALDDGSIRVHWTDDFSIAGTCSLGYSDDSTGNYGILAWAPLNSLLFPRKISSYEQMMEQLPDEIRESHPISKEEYNAKTYQLEGGAISYNLWYCSAKDGKGDTLLWDAGNPSPEGIFADVNYHLAYYCVALVVLAAFLAMAGRHWDGKWYGELFVRMAILCASLCLSVVIVTAGQFMEIYGELTEAMIDSSAVAVPMTLTALFGRQLYLLSRQDKGL